jgi:hypothetical protein
MRAKHFFLTCGFVLALCLVCGARGNNGTQKRSPAGEDHLVPAINMEMFGPGYAALFKKQLLVTRANCARMIIIPSVGKELAVSVYSDRGAKAGADFNVTLTKANMTRQLAPLRSGLTLEFLKR